MKRQEKKFAKDNAPDKPLEFAQGASAAASSHPVAFEDYKFFQYQNTPTILYFAAREINDPCVDCLLLNVPENFGQLNIVGLPTNIKTLKINCSEHCIVYFYMADLSNNLEFKNIIVPKGKVSLKSHYSYNKELKFTEKSILYGNVLFNKYNKNLTPYTYSKNCEHLMNGIIIEVRDIGVIGHSGQRYRDCINFAPTKSTWKNKRPKEDIPPNLVETVPIPDYAYSGEDQQDKVFSGYPEDNYSPADDLFFSSYNQTPIDPHIDFSVFGNEMNPVQAGDLSDLFSQVVPINFQEPLCNQVASQPPAASLKRKREKSEELPPNKQARTNWSADSASTPSDRNQRSTSWVNRSVSSKNNVQGLA